MRWFFLVIAEAPPKHGILTASSPLADVNYEKCLFRCLLELVISAAIQYRRGLVGLDVVPMLGCLIASNILRLYDTAEIINLPEGCLISYTEDQREPQ